MLLRATCCCAELSRPRCSRWRVPATCNLCACCMLLVVPTRRIFPMHLLQDERSSWVCILPRGQVVPLIVNAQMRRMTRAQRRGDRRDRGRSASRTRRRSRSSRSGRSASQSDGRHDHESEERERSGGEQWSKASCEFLSRVRVRAPVTRKLLGEQRERGTHTGDEQQAGWRMRPGSESNFAVARRTPLTRAARTISYKMK